MAESWGSEAGGDGVTPDTDRVLTVPNALSALRLVGVPVFLWLILARHDGWSLVVLTLAGISDYLDGKIARRFHLVSRVGQLLDPIADRLYILAALLGLAWRELIPWWLVAALLAREVLLAWLMLALRRVGQIGLPVHFIGKAATFALLYAFPIVLLAEVWPPAATWTRPLGWALVWWGLALYWLAAAFYGLQAAPVLRAGRVRPA